jgi:hypothetical protein
LIKYNLKSQKQTQIDSSGGIINLQGKDGLDTRATEEREKAI